MSVLHSFLTFKSGVSLANISLSSRDAEVPTKVIVSDLSHTYTCSIILDTSQSGQGSLIKYNSLSSDACNASGTQRNVVSNGRCAVSGKVNLLNLTVCPVSGGMITDYQISSGGQQTVGSLLDFHWIAFIHVRLMWARKRGALEELKP